MLHIIDAKANFSDKVYDKCFSNIWTTLLRNFFHSVVSQMIWLSMYRMWTADIYEANVMPCIFLFSVKYPAKSTV